MRVFGKNMVWLLKMKEVTKDTIETPKRKKYPILSDKEYSRSSFKCLAQHIESKGYRFVSFLGTRIRIPKIIILVSILLYLF